MLYQATSATRKIAGLTKRIRAIQGGTAASKTISTLLILIDLAQRDKVPTITSIVSESFPHLKRGVIRDFLDIMETHKYFDPNRWNKTDFIYTFETGSRIEFFSADQPAKVRGPRRDRLFINECDHLSYETFTQLEIRTKETIWLDWNPATEFWFYDKVQSRPDCDHLILTYKDNEALQPAIIEAIESRRNNTSWFRVYGLGLLGEVASRIYRGWNIIDEVPHEARLERRWLDFGYTSDPTSIGDVYYYNGGYILDEVAYLKGLSNKRIADILLAQREPDCIVVADSAEPKSIDELKAFGLMVVPSQKGPGSVYRGIQFVQAQRISVTKRSINTLKEYRNYIFFVDKDGKQTNDEDPHCENHSMAGIRYALGNLDPTPEDGPKPRTLSELRSEPILEGMNPFHYEDSGNVV